MKTMKNKNFGLRTENARNVGPLSHKDSPSNPPASFGRDKGLGLREGTTILKTNVKNNSKLRPFNRIMGDVGKMQYFPAWSKEWRNSVYHYNSNLIKNFPVRWLGKSSNIWDKLSNYGNPLKLMVPNYSWKTICGWINYSGKVISQKMSENKMGNRVSKSVVLENVTVKEQRVNGSWCGGASSNLGLRTHLRCTLMGFERNYQVKIPSNQIINKFRSYMSKAAPVSLINLDPLFITGFADAESNFLVSINPSAQGPEDLGPGPEGEK